MVANGPINLSVFMNNINEPINPFDVPDQKSIINRQIDTL